MLEVAYNGNHSLRLPIIGDYNQALRTLPADLSLCSAPSDSMLRPDHLG